MSVLQPSVEHEEQKPVNELLNMFGGRKQPTPKKEVPKTVVHKVDRPINRVPAIRSRASSVSSEKGSEYFPGAFPRALIFTICCFSFT